MTNHSFNGKCAICGRELLKPCWGKGPFEDVCPKCFTQRFWDLAEEENLKGTKLIIDGTCYAHDSKDPHGFGGHTFLVQLLPNHPKYLDPATLLVDPKYLDPKYLDPTTFLANPNIWEFKGTLWSNGPIPESQRNKEAGRLMDNAVWFKEQTNE